MSCRVTRDAYHNTEAQAQRASQENITFLDVKIAFPGEKTDNNVNTDNGGTEDTCWRQLELEVRGARGAMRLTNTAYDAHDPSSGIIVEVSSR